jgi:hypothetical protein
MPRLANGDADMAHVVSVIHRRPVAMMLLKVNHDTFRLDAAECSVPLVETRVVLLAENDHAAVVSDGRRDHP